MPKFTPVLKVDKSGNPLRNPDTGNTIVDKDKIDIQILHSDCDTLKIREDIHKNRRFVVDPIFEAGEIHLIAGPSGSGKSTWLLQLIKDFEEGKEILGYRSNPEPYLYLSCDRSMNQLGLTLERMGLEKWDIKAKTITQIDIEYNLDQADIHLEKLPEYFPEVKLFFIEALGFFMPEGNKNNYNDLLKFWSKIRVMVEKHNLTIIGTTHCPKAKSNERYGNPRDRIIGSVAQAGVSSTVVIFEFGDEKDVMDNTRLISICPRNAPNQLRKYVLDEKGKLVFAEIVVPEKKKDEEKKLNILDELFVGGKHEKGGILDSSYFTWLKTESKVSKATLYRKIDEWIGEGFIERNEKGFYIVTKLPTKIKVN